MASSPSLCAAALRVAEGGDATLALALLDSLERGTDTTAAALCETCRAADGNECATEGPALWLVCVASRNGVPGAVDLARTMVALGADPNARGVQGVARDETAPLWWAAAAVEAGVVGATALARDLINAGADVDAEGTYDFVRGPPIWWAAVAVRNGEADAGVELAEALLDAGADANRRGSYGPTAVNIAPLALAAQAAPENAGCTHLCGTLLRGGARMEGPEMLSLLMYRVGSSVVAVKNILRGGN